MMLARQLLEWLDQGRELIGEIQIQRANEGFILRHWQDLKINGLALYRRAEDAIEIGKYDAAGKYRPLRSAPTLRRGWEISLGTIEEVTRCLDFFYPAMLGTFRAFENGAAQPVDLRETLNRQTGMYRVAGKITNEQADAVIGEVCPPNRCLKTILWKIEPGFPIHQLPGAKMDPAHDLLEREPGFIPLLCEECCNILVAAARETVKKVSSTTPTPP